MASRTGCLRPDVAVEPLVGQWFAWSYLISPATAALYTANGHVMLLESFLSAPELHVAALRNPAMRGGPFVEHDPSRAGEIRHLLDETRRRRGRLLDFAEGVRQLHELLARRADGSSLEPIYQEVPEPLRGYVELVYDVEHRAGARFLEGLLYRSPYHDEAWQSVHLSRVGAAPRPFAFSTPRLPGEGQVALPLPFTSPLLDELYRARYEPQPIEALAERLSVPPDARGAFEGLFADPRSLATPAEPYRGEGVRIRYFGHACLLIESGGTSLMIDPALGHGGEGPPRFSFADLPPVIDYLLITHNHQDHCILESLLELRHRVREIVVPRSGGGLADPSLRLMLRHLGFERVSELVELEAISIDGGSIVALPFLGEHADLDIRAKAGFAVTLKGRTMLLLADSNNLEPRLYEHVRGALGAIDLMFVGMECEGAPMSWLYGPLLTRPLARKADRSRRLNGSSCDKAMDIVRRFVPRQVFVYAMGQEPWLSHIMSVRYTESSPQIVESNALISACRAMGTPAERLYWTREIELPPG